MPNTAETAKSRFLLGLLLTWVPSILAAIPGIVSAISSVSHQKATGLGAVAGGFSEGFITFSLATVLVSQITAIVLLSRSFAGGGGLRGCFSVLSICWSGLALVMLGSFVWVFVIHPFGPAR